MFWLTMRGRSASQASAELVSTRTENLLLERVVHDTPRNAQAPLLLCNIIRRAQFVSYLAHANDDPPGNTAM
jgi:hypothetical protein